MMTITIDRRQLGGGTLASPNGRLCVLAFSRLSKTNHRIALRPSKNRLSATGQFAPSSLRLNKRQLLGSQVEPLNGGYIGGWRRQASVIEAEELAVIRKPHLRDVPSGSLSGRSPG
ncbi:hypothetical protein [Sphingosinicella sp.]|uniref:hypothetical protein n=1 Tax=Sphingosinicella sp. TaxID=1917971 RepID=UPI002625F21C|nr:hypothetical protein [Sphingosinicella sp.]